MVDFYKYGLWSDQKGLIFLHYITILTSCSLIRIFWKYRFWAPWLFTTLLWDMNPLQINNIWSLKLPKEKFFHSDSILSDNFYHKHCGFIWKIQFLDILNYLCRYFQLIQNWWRHDIFAYKNKEFKWPEAKLRLSKKQSTSFIVCNH